MAKSAVAGMKMIPAGFRVITLPSGQTALTPRRRSRRRYKLSKARRMSIAASARKFKVPVLTLAVNAPWVAKSMEVSKYNGGGWTGFRRAAEQVIMPAFTGVKIDSTGKMSFSLGNLAWGLLPNAMLGITKRSGLLRGAQKSVSRFRLPVSLT